MWTSPEDGVGPQRRPSGPSRIGRGWTHRPTGHTDPESTRVPSTGRRVTFRGVVREGSGPAKGAPKERWVCRMSRAVGVLGVVSGEWGKEGDETVGRGSYPLRGRPG